MSWISGKPKGRRRIRRGALPSSLMGLVAFSFTLVIFGSAVYTAVLPSLAVAASQSKSQNPLHEAVEEAVVAQTGVDPQERLAAMSAAKTQAKKQQVQPARKSVTLGGKGLQSLTAKPASKPKEDAKPVDKPKDDKDKQDKPDKKPSDKPEQPEKPGQGDPEPDPLPGPDQGQGEGPNQDDPNQEPGQDPEPPAEDPDKHQADYDFLAGKVASVESFLAQVDACVSSFNNDQHADLSTRRAHLGSCQALSSQLLGEYVATRDYRLSPGSPYSAASGDLVAMFRCLNGYLGTIQEAWSINVNFDDPAAHVDEYMAPIYRDAPGGTNVHQAEFFEYYNGFVL